MRNTTSWKILPVSIFMFPLALLPQMPPQPARLAISSEPPGAIVMINGKQMSQRTNVRFAVSPGNYTVSVTSADGKLKCPNITLSVSGGQTVARDCTAAGWK